MKTTLNIDDRVMDQLKREGVTDHVGAGRNSPALVVSEPEGLEASSAPSISFKGGYLVDIAGRESLYQAMEGR